MFVLLYALILLSLLLLSFESVAINKYCAIVHKISHCKPQNNVSKINCLTSKVRLVVKIFGSPYLLVSHSGADWSAPTFSTLPFLTLAHFPLLRFPSLQLMQGSHTSPVIRHRTCESMVTGLVPGCCSKYLDGWLSLGGQTTSVFHQVTQASSAS